MSEQNPPSGFNWGLGATPKKPEDEGTPPAAARPAAPPAHPAPPPPLVAPPAPPAAAAESKYPPPPQTFPHRTAPPVIPTTGQAPPPPAPSSPAPPPPAPASPAAWDQPTQAYDYRSPLEPPAASPGVDQLTQPYAFDRSIDGATDVLGAQPVGLPMLRDEGPRPGQTSAIDSLFGEAQFKEYDDSALPAEGFGALTSSRPRVPREPMGRTQKILVIVAGGLLALLVLVAVFMLGLRNPGVLPQPEEAAPAVEEPVEPVAAPPAVGPLAPGTYAWDELLGTECLEPFDNAWADEFTVVDCTSPHAAQLVSRGIFADEAYAPYPEATELQARINLLCTAPSSVNYAVAGGLSDIAVSASYPASAEQWDAGVRDYYCFLTRSSGEPLTVSLANPPVAEAAPVASVPGNDP